MTSAIETTLWIGMKDLEPASRLGGILAYKPSYHAPRYWLQVHYPQHYSIAQFAVDREGPADKASAIDWTFTNAQAGDYTTIAKYSRRLLNAGRALDVRTVYMREFFGNADLDSEVEGWDFARDQPSSSDNSHLWHIHISIHRKYIDSNVAMRAILSILSGESEEQWTGNLVDTVDVTGKLPILKQGFSDPVNGYYYIQRVQDLMPKAYNVTVDGDYGPLTAAAIKRYNAEYLARKVDGKTVDAATWKRLYAIR